MVVDVVEKWMNMAKAEVRLIIVGKKHALTRCVHLTILNLFGLC